MRREAWGVVCDALRVKHKVRGVMCEELGAGRQMRGVKFEGVRCVV